MCTTVYEIKYPILLNFMYLSLEMDCCELSDICLIYIVVLSPFLNPNFIINLLFSSKSTITCLGVNFNSK